MKELTIEQISVLLGNGFFSQEELSVYREYDPTRLGCSLENRFIILADERSYVHQEYELMDLLMEAAYGEDGMNWRLIEQRLIQGVEPSSDSTAGCPFYADELIVLTPVGSEESYFFDVTAYLSPINQQPSD